MGLSSYVSVCEEGSIPDMSYKFIESVVCLTEKI